MRRVHADGVLRKLEHPLGLLVFGHDSAQIGHCLAVAFSVGDCGEGVGAAVVLGDGDDVGPFFGVSVFAHYDCWRYSNQAV